MQDIGKIFSLSAVVFLILGLLFNLMPRLPRIPGDIYLDKLGFRIYIPFISTIVTSVILILLFNFFKK
ncbi:hypothetical protein A3J19_01225 [Candidatus Daviesbacteria bacterium RIFCSPLOWO2_02_FULL_41_8]|uniref:DUF2905 domain-containing protein n=2 Tax=Candidatus Daviesiibacteriota TaxID=1752718 RepID=A0A1F5NK80_9BACT|nr:MAG: hypothetical protein A2871_02915 [Candidatus Daviesbacteria bacterium RIFCSPHIGHO2_01_FULL_41_23]OGE78079.1 MAG: hypothetical protein A3J19_01225 [Candidatus Daviesbacteria bacterium RIFCSPLOWO2_02_FULL_41_8]